MRLRDRVKREVGYFRRMGGLLGRLRNVKPDNELTFADISEGWARERPYKVALVHGERAMTYRELDAWANRFGNLLRAQGVSRGDTVALLLPNRLEYIPCWLGAIKVGATCALINNHLMGHALAHTLSVADAKVLVHDGSTAEAWASAREHVEGELPAFDLDGEGDGGLPSKLAAASAELPPGIRRGLTCKDRALYIYTSGTTGLPKAANISHLRLLTMMHAFAGCMESNDEDRIYVPLPLYHATGGIGGVGAALTVGGTVVIRDRFSASRFWDDIVEHDCTMFLYIGELCRYLVNTPEHRLERRHRIRCCMGNGLRPEVWERFRDRFALPHIVEFYGSSEGNVAFFNVDDRVGSIGRLPDYMRRIFQVRIVQYDVEAEEVVRGPDGRCIEVPNGTAGEAIGRINDKLPGGRFEGYSNEAATKKKILTDVFEPGDRWFRTGDLLSKDDEGYYYFVDRIGDTFRWKGENVATSEVAEVISVVDGVQEVNVYGVQVPGADGRAGMAALVTDDGFDLEAFHAHLSRELAPYAQPLFLRFQRDIEVTGTFKHKKGHLVKDGFDPAAIDEPIYFRDDAEGRFVRLDPELYLRIGRGEVRV